MANMWMVRAGRNSILIDEFERLNVVAIGWGLGDLTNKTPDEIKELVNRHYPDKSNQTKGKYAANEIKFRHDIKEEDYVLSYNSWDHYYLFGKIVSDYYFDPSLISEEYSDVRDVEWLCKIPKDNLKQSTQNTLGALLTVFSITDEAYDDILMNIEKEDIKQIRTVTLVDTNSDSLTYDDAINFLSNVLMNERDGHFHYIRKNVNLIGRTLVLFKYKGKLIAKGIFIDEVAEKVSIKNENYNGYYLVEKDSIAIFREPISLADFKKYVRNIKSFNRDVIIDLKYLDKVNQMIQDYASQIEVKDYGNQYDLPVTVIKDYLNKNNFGDLTSEETEKLLSKFYSMFSPEKLKNLEGSDILYNIFPQKGNKSTLCYNLEFSDDFKWLNGGIRGGSSFKFSLFKYDETNKWTVGSAKSNLKSISENKAIELAEKIKDAIVEGAEYVQNNNLDSIEDFIAFEEELNKIFEESQKYCPISPLHSWIHKYYSIIFPDKFIGIHTDKMKKDFLRKFRIQPENGFYANDWQIYNLAKKTGIKLYSLYDENIVRLFFESESIWDPIDKGKLVDLSGYTNSNSNTFESNLKRNIIYFGAPGTGKSFNLEKEKVDLLGEEFNDNYERVTFHPDYSYANFVGVYKPVPDEDKNGEPIISYEYVAGPFMRVLVKALDKPDEPFLLIIEEINRANVAAVFGEVFQLLDRKDNISRYDIQLSKDMKDYMRKELGKEYERIKIPQNLFIWATMNSADQGVFPMDSAFKRRWDFKYIGINNQSKKASKLKINGISWNTIREAINEMLLSNKINEDKLLGSFFAFSEYIPDDDEIEEDIIIDETEFNKVFKNKILMYLFEDVAKPIRNDLFEGAKGDKDYVTYSEICDKFDDMEFNIFHSTVSDKIYGKTGE